MCSDSEMFIVFFVVIYCKRCGITPRLSFQLRSQHFFIGDAETLCTSFASSMTVQKVSKYKHKQCCAYLSFF